MNILHVTPYFAPAWAFGGVCRAVHGLAAAQRAAGQAVAVLTTDALSRTSRAAAGDDRVDGIPVTRLRNVSLTARRVLNLSTPSGVVRAVSRAIDAGRIDVVHCHELRTVETLAAIRAVARRPAVALVVSPHGTTTYETGRAGLKAAWDRLLAARTWPRVDRVIALTGTEAAEIQAVWARRGVPTPRGLVAVVPNGVDADALARLPTRALAEARWRLGGARVVLYLGRLAPRKQVPLLVDAFARAASAVPHARLILAGPDEGAGPAIADAIRRGGIGNKVVLTGMLSGDDRLLALAAADVFALPAIGEGQPMAALEAMAAGVPVLLSPECHLPEAAASGAGLVVPRTVDAWHEALITLLGDPDRQRVMGRQARALAMRDHSWPRVAAQTCAVYDGARRDLRARA